MTTPIYSRDENGRYIYKGEVFENISMYYADDGVYMTTYSATEGARTQWFSTDATSNLTTNSASYTMSPMIHKEVKETLLDPMRPRGVEYD